MPLALSAFAAWRADYTDTSTNFDWLDRTGNGHTLRQTTAGNKPTVVSDIVNGRPVVRLDGTDDYLVSIDAAATWRFLHDGVGQTVFIVGVPRGAASSIYPWFSTADITGTNTGFTVFHRGPASNLASVCALNGSGTRLFLSEPAGAAKDAVCVREVSWINDGGSPEWVNYENGVLLSSGTVAAVPAAGDSTGTLHVGRYATGATYGHLDIAEIVIFNRELTADERTSMYAYFDRYGL